jgi:drug/metabolite transporter (DMT)-like permease
LFRFGVPALFVFIWSTGFIVGKAVVPHADLQLYLLARLTLTTAVLAAAAMVVRAKWPNRRGWGAHLLAGALMQGGYLCASYWALQRGMPAGVMALIGALQPLFTALYIFIAGTPSSQATVRAAPGTPAGVSAVAAASAPARPHTLGLQTWIGLLIGFGGVACVLAPKLSATGAGALTFASTAVALLSVVSITAGALFQKWLPPTDLRVAGAVQNLAGALVAMFATMTVGALTWDNAPVLWGALVWAVLVPSVVGTTLLIWMMRHNEATKVTALVLLAPPLAAVQAYLFFRETLSPIQFTGFALALVGVLLARSARLGPPPATPTPSRRR